MTVNFNDIFAGKDPGLKPPAGRFALGRLPAGQMNKTETAYSIHLEYRRLQEEVLWWSFDAIHLRLAPGLFYEPDFIVMLSSGLLEVHEVKGMWEDDAKAKFKMAASLFPFKFIAVHKVSKKDGGGWRFVDF